MNLYSAYIIL